MEERGGLNPLNPPYIYALDIPTHTHWFFHIYNLGKKSMEIGECELGSLFAFLGISKHCAIMTK